MTLTFAPMLNTPTTRYSVQSGCEFLSEAYYWSKWRNRAGQLVPRQQVHNAEDWNATTGGDTDLGDIVRTIQGGTVTAVEYDRNYIGGIVEVLLQNGYTYGAWHLRDIHVKKGQYVNAGSIIGQVGKGSKWDMPAHAHLYLKKPGVELVPTHWPSTHIKDKAACEAFVREHYEALTPYLKRHGALWTLADYEGMKGEPGRLLLVQGDQITDLTGKSLQLHGNGISVSAETTPFRIYANNPTPVSIPALPARK